MKSNSDFTNLRLPRVMLAAPASGSGKTLVTCGLLQAFQNRKVRTAAFKCGPDYIDPMFHERVIGVPSRNLDTFFTDGQTTRYLFGRQAEHADISVIEGVMGFYDGVAGITTEASSWELARVTETPVILVVNARGMSLSVVPFIAGFLDFPGKWKKSMIRGVILNQVSASVYTELKLEIESRLPVRVLGYVPRVDDCVIESRHLGLVTPDEIDGLKEKLQKLAGMLEETLEMDEILELAESAPTLDVSMPDNLRGLLKTRIADNCSDTCSEETRLTDSQNEVDVQMHHKIPIAVARDEAFCFYYADNLELLESLGAELVYFSPLNDAGLPKGVRGLLLGGGYPELYAETLSKNQSMLDSVRTQIGRGLPYLAECGGFMYLHQSMEDMEGISRPMAGVFPGQAYKTDRLNRFGYITLTENGSCTAANGTSQSKETIWLGGAGGSIRAHEFHYFDSTQNGTAFHAIKPWRKKSWDCMIAGKSMAAGFPHLYYYSNPEFAVHFLKVCREYCPL